MEQVGSTFKEALQKTLDQFGDNPDVEQVVVIVAKKDGTCETITDINRPLTLTMRMLAGAAEAIYEQKLALVKQTQGAPEIVES
jgi:hypothetical protein